MAQGIDYAPPSSDRGITILCAVTWMLMLFGPIAAALAGNLHAGLRTLPVYADMEARDVVATAVICGMPAAGILVAVLLIWRSRKGRWAGTVLGVVAVVVHTWSLYAWGSLEVGFWRG